VHDKIDENPLITRFIGAGDIVIGFHHRGHQFSLMGRHSLRGHDQSRGAVQVQWALPIKGQMKVFFQVFHGYGEILIDYNHKQTTLGFGLSWLGSFG
jgi:phospholipase A1